MAVCVDGTEIIAPDVVRKRKPRYRGRRCESCLDPAVRKVIKGERTFDLCHSQSCEFKIVAASPATSQC